ncbi:DMT family transporter [Neogemmobacter tilapiae]|uniref:Peptide ABC transporter permease n=1 Tax=Neogemmobacter tilapiae TaxID=875041 RepID=A0A918TR86_9RHOB|nr:DMT family transporter [Gemmobacter tilapiae]GHC55700.1 peptide ABC transporter permease [Gemmobacter tilapiae]
MKLDLKSLAMGLAFALMWSSAFATARIIVADAPPLLSLTLRFALSGLLALALAPLFKQSFRLTPHQWRATLIFGLCQNALYLGLNFHAMQSIEASLAAIIASTMPLLVATLGLLFFRQTITPLATLGLVLGFLGTTLIMTTRLTQGAPLTPILLCLLAALALGLATLLVKGASTPQTLLPVVGFQMLTGALTLLPLSLLTEDPIIHLSLPWIAAFLYQALIPGLLATLIWFALVLRIGPVRAATFHFLNPFFGVLIAHALLSEPIRPLDIAGVLVVMLGIYLVQTRRPPA